MSQDNTDETGSEAAPRSALIWPLNIIAESIKHVPSMRFALAAVAVGVAASFVLGLFTEPLIAFFSLIAAVPVMVIIAVFQKLTGLEDAAFRRPAIAILWFYSAIVIAATALLFSSVFFDSPLKLKYWLEGETNVTEPITNVEPELSNNSPLIWLVDSRSRASTPHAIRTALGFYNQNYVKNDIDLSNIDEPKWVDDPNWVTNEVRLKKPELIVIHGSAWKPGEGVKASAASFAELIQKIFRVQDAVKVIVYSRSFQYNIYDEWACAVIENWSAYEGLNSIGAEAFQQIFITYLPSPTGEGVSATLPKPYDLDFPNFVEAVAKGDAEPRQPVCTPNMNVQ